MSERTARIVHDIADIPADAWNRCATSGAANGSEYNPFLDHRFFEVATRVPLGRFGTVEEIADAIVFLVSDRSSYVTGHALVVDGGERLVGAGPES